MVGKLDIDILPFVRNDKPRVTMISGSDYFTYTQIKFYKNY